MLCTGQRALCGPAVPLLSGCRAAEAFMRKHSHPHTIPDSKKTKRQGRVVA